MDRLVVVVAQYLPLLVPAAAAAVWLTLPRVQKVGLAAQAVVSAVVVAGLIQLAAAVHVDPRPFVADPSVQPLFAHPADNGFPSDHTALASTAALLVLIYRRRAGAVLLGAAILAGLARVAAPVHHLQDVAGGILIAAVTVAVAAAIWGWVGPRLPRRLTDRAA